LTVAGAIESASAISSIVSPPKYLSSATCACRLFAGLELVEARREPPGFPRRRRRSRNHLVQRDRGFRLRPLLGELPPRAIDENPAHAPRGDAEEVASVLPLDLRLVDQAQVGLVDERGHLQRLIAALAPHVGSGNLAKLAVDGGEQAVARIGVALAPRLEHLRDVGRFARITHEPCPGSARTIPGEPLFLQSSRV
jgi:hypothetical protein